MTKRRTFVCGTMPRALLLALVAALVGGCDIFREAYYQNTGRSEGKLVANIGMPLEEVERRSTLKLSAGFRAPSGTVEKAAQAVFDLELYGTGVRLERCRQYFLFTRKDDSHLDNITIYATPSDWTWAQVDAVQQSTRQKLSADGWTPGRFVYHTPELQALHAGGADGYGDYWLKGDVLFQIDPRPTETQLVGSDPHAGQFTLYYRIQPMRWDDHPNLEFPGHEHPTPSVGPKATSPKPPRR
ncbi:MAG TPA: hypothetical protein VE821_03890 [Pyrinomonadaceae bacterium]|nr:hypothetical protein [Pyrinomonadaceae bacterium]